MILPPRLELNIAYLLRGASPTTQRLQEGDVYRAKVLVADVTDGRAYAERKADAVRSVTERYAARNGLEAAVGQASYDKSSELWWVNVRVAEKAPERP